MDSTVIAAKPAVTPPRNAILDQLPKGHPLKDQLLIKGASIKMKDLPDPLNTQLLKLDEKNAGKARSADAPPLYLVQNGTFHFIEDYIHRDEQPFRAITPVGLTNPINPAKPVIYRGGAGLAVDTGKGFIAAFDERHHWFKFPGGVARFSEGNDLLACAVREALEEELFLVGNNGGECLLYTHKNEKSLKQRLRLFQEIWRKELTDQYIGAEPAVYAYIRNDDDMSVDAVCGLDLRVMDGGGAFLQSVHMLEDDWFRGGRYFPHPVLIDYQGCLAGVWNDRQGGPFEQGALFPQKNPVVDCALTLKYLGVLP